MLIDIVHEQTEMRPMSNRCWICFKPTGLILVVLKRKILFASPPRKDVMHNIEFDLINAKEVGEQECRAFNQQRLQSTLPVWSYRSFIIR